MANTDQYRFTFDGITFQVPMCGRTLIQTPQGELLMANCWDHEARTVTVHRHAGPTAIDPAAYVQAKPV